MKHNLFGMAASAILTFGLAGCGGGGGGGTGLASTPPPTPTPTPTTTSPFGVTADVSFPTVGDDVEFRWVESAKAYEIRLPGQDWERLSPASAELYPASGTYGIRLSKNLGYSYTNLATQFENGWGFPIGLFAYGIPTAAGNVPTTGTASYAANVYGRASQGAEPWAYDVHGTTVLVFDFGAGTLAGHFDPVLDGSSYQLGRYEFINTVFGVGSAQFSGQLSLAGTPSPGSFEGLFTGPAAAELMAEWRAPYLNPTTNNWETMKGVWIGKKGN